MTLQTPREAAEVLLEALSKPLTASEAVWLNTVEAAISADRCALLAEDEALIEAMARSLFGPLNEVWDQRWRDLHESGYTYPKWSEDLQGGKEGHRHDARIALAVARRHRGVE